MSGTIHLHQQRRGGQAGAAQKHYGYYVDWCYRCLLGDEVKCIHALKKCEAKELMKIVREAKHGPTPDAVVGIGRICTSGPGDGQGG